MPQIDKIKLDNSEISIISNTTLGDYICITDMVKAKDGDNRANVLVQNWLRKKDTIQYVGVWEKLYNPDFNCLEFEAIKNSAGVNSFLLSPKEWCKRTGAIGIVSKAGRYGGTYAHKDIAYHFGMWLSPEFNLLIIKEYQRLKDAQNDPVLGEWNIKRILAKTNYSIHTDAVQKYVLPQIDIERDKLYVYATEADLLNLALWGCTAQQWRQNNEIYAKKGLNIRDSATINELVVLSNMESFNSELIKRNLPREDRFRYLRQMAQQQLAHLERVEIKNNFKKELDEKYNG